MPLAPSDLSRRTFIRRGIAGVTAVTLAGTVLARNGWPTPDSAPGKVDETEPLALQLGYHVDAASVDESKFPQYTNQQSCRNCQLYTGTPNEPWGPCTIFGYRLVAAGGWCSAWTAKES